MSNIAQKKLPSKEQLPDYLIGISPEERYAWITILKKHLKVGDQTDIVLIANEDREKKITIRDVDNVLRGRSYNPEFGPKVIESLLKVIENRKSKELKATTMALSFMKEYI